MGEKINGVLGCTYDAAGVGVGVAGGIAGAPPTGLPGNGERAPVTEGPGGEGTGIAGEVGVAVAATSGGASEKGGTNPGHLPQVI